jgi:hypothetical protein
MKKSFKFGNGKENWALILKLIIAIVIGIVIFFVVKIISDDISKWLGWLTNVLGGAGNAYAKCFDCKNQRDANGKLMTEKEACPPWGYPFLNAECGAFFGTIASTLLALLAGLLIFLRYKGGRTALSESAKLHNNLSDKEQKEIADRSKKEAEDLMKTKDGDDAFENYKENLERAGFKQEWEKDSAHEKVPDDAMKNKDAFDDWVKTQGPDATALQSKIRNDINSKITPKDFTKTLGIMRTTNSFNAEGHPSSPQQKTAADIARKAQLSEQGAALGKKAGLEEAGKSMAEEAADKKSGDEKEPWEKGAKMGE